MSETAPSPHAQSDAPAAPPAKPALSAVAYGFTPNFPAILRELDLSLAVTTYQAQRVMTFAAAGPSKLFMWMRVFDRPTGLALDRDTLSLCAQNTVWHLHGERDLRDAAGKPLPQDICYCPRRANVTGDIAGHEMVHVGGVLHIVNTRFSCLATLDDRFSFRPAWKPPFITALAPEDRCHLNGIAIDKGAIRYLTALGETDTKDGWRPNKASGGILMEYPSGKVVARNLSMPHSPRVYRGAVWLLDSGRGELVQINIATGERAVRARFRGFLRGLAFAGDYAFVGVCKIREKRTFGNLPIESLYPPDQFECAIHAVHLRDASRSGAISFTKGIEELFDIQVLPGIRNPTLLGFEEDTINGVFVVP